MGSTHLPGSPHAGYQLASLDVVSPLDKQFQRVGVEGVNVLSLPRPIVFDYDCVTVVIDAVALAWKIAGPNHFAASGREDRCASWVGKIQAMVNSIWQGIRKHRPVSIAIPFQVIIAFIRGDWPG